MKNKFWLRSGLFLLMGSFLLSAAVTIIPILPVYETQLRPETNTLDSPAIWAGDNPENSILFITAKGSDNVEMHNPVTNEFIGVLGQAGSGPGEFSYPNGIALAYDFNYNGNLIDLVMVVERDNHRVSVFEVPGLDFLGTFGDNDLDQPYGITVYQDGSDIYAYITETGSNEGVFIYRLTTSNNTFGGTFVKHFPVNGTLESLVVDPYLKRTLICNEIVAGYVFVYSLWGDTLITTFGQGHFSGDTEGIVLYDCGQDSGYVIVADQLSPTEFEVFSRKTYQHIGNFCGADPYITSGTDGATLTQRSLPNLPHGAYFAVHSDRVVHCYDWSDIANAFGLCNNTLAPEPNITVNPGALNYGNVVINTSLSKVVEVRNNGGADLIVNATSLIGSNAGEFSIDSGGAPFTLSFGESQDITVSFNPVSAGVKSATLRIESNDPDDNPFDVPLTGTGIGIPPVWSIPAVLEFPEDETLTLDLDSLLSDENDPNSTLAITYQGGSHVSVSLNSTTHLVIFTAPLNFNGTDTVIFTATDPGGFSASDTVTILVTPVNDPPVVNLPLVEFEEDSIYTFDLDTVVTDIDHDTSEISWSFAFPENFLKIIENQWMIKLEQSDLRIINTAGIWLKENDSLMISIDSLTHITTISATANFYGLDIPVMFTAVDDSGAGDTDTTTISVFPVNDPPVIATPLPNAVFNEDDTLVYAISQWFPFVSDPDHMVEELSYLLESGQYVSADSGSNSYVLSAPQNWFGRDTLQLIVSDGMLADTADFYVTVHSVNDPPTLKLPESVEFSADTSVILKIWKYANDVETEDSLLSYNFSTSNDSLLTEFNAPAGELTLSALVGFSGMAFLYVTVSDDSGAIALDSMEVIISPLTGIGSLSRENIPTEYVIHQNYPNPFNPTTHIRFGLPRATHVKLTIYNIVGQRVAVLVDEERDTGYHVVNFNGAGMASGIYLYHLQAGNFQRIKKMLLLK